MGAGSKGNHWLLWLCSLPHFNVAKSFLFCSLSTIGWGWRPPSRHDQAPASQSSRPDPRPTLGLSSLVHVPCCAKPPNTTKILPWAEPRAHLVASESFSFHRLSSCGRPTTMVTERYSSLGWDWTHSIQHLEIHCCVCIIEYWRWQQAVIQSQEMTSSASSARFKLKVIQYDNI